MIYGTGGHPPLTQPTIQAAEYTRPLLGIAACAGNFNGKPYIVHCLMNLNNKYYLFIEIILYILQNCM